MRGLRVTRRFTGASIPAAAVIALWPAVAWAQDGDQNAGGFVGLMIAVLVAIALFFVLDQWYPILRDIPAPDAPPGQQPTNRPYSLGRFQMVIWTSVIFVAAGYLYWFHRATLGSPLDLISGSAAVLLGISGGSAVVSAFIDSSKDAKQAEAEKAADVATAAGAPQAAVLQQQADSLKRTAVKGGFFQDILEDDNGNSLHRIQILIFTLMLAFIFCWEVVNQFKMPTFSDSTLGLMGISGGVYLGFKLPDKGS